MLPFAIHAAYEKFNVSKGISFHSLNIRAEEFVESTVPVFGDDLLALSANGEMRPRERETVLERAKNADKSIVANCRLFAEGVDVPEWELVVMADPVRSPVLAKQMIGRVSRRYPEKERGYVLLPTLLDDFGIDKDGNEIPGGDGEGYDMFVAAFQAMIDDNPDLERDVAFIMAEGERLGEPLGVDKYPRSIREAFRLPPSMSLERRSLLTNRMIVKVQGGGVTEWDVVYNLLKAYKEREGDCLVPVGHIEGKKRLGAWVRRQRDLQKRGTLFKRRKDILDEIGFVWDVAADQWERMCTLLEQFIEREGHADVPRSHKEDGENLGKWLSNQRQFKKKGTLDPEQEKRLEKLGVSWDPLGYQWERMFTFLEQFVGREGHADVPFRYKEGGVKLGTWLHTQRTIKKKGTLDAEREERLVKLGVKWTIRST